MMMVMMPGRSSILHHNKSFYAVQEEGGDECGVSILYAQ